MYNTICVCLYIFDIHSAVCNHLGICSLPYRLKANTTLKMFSMFCFFGFEECLAAWHMIAQVPFGKGQLVKPLPCGQPLLSRRWCHLQHQTFCQGRQVLKKTWSPSQKLSPAFDGFFLGEVLVFKLSFDDPNDLSVLWALLSGNLNDELWFLPWPCDACQVSPFWLGWVHSIHLVPWFPVAA